MLNIINIYSDTPAYNQDFKYNNFFFSLAAAVKAEDELDVDGTIEEDLGKSRDGSKTDDEVVQR